MPNMLEQVGIFVVSIAIATISWRFIEQPFRVKNPKSSSLKVVNLGGITALVVVAIAAIPVALKGFPDRFPKTADKYFAAKGDRDARYHDCVRLINRNENWGDVCVYGDTSQPRAKVALWGDSHAAALIPALDVAGQNSGVGVKMYARLSCPGILDLELFGQQTGQKCPDFVDTTSKLIMQDVDIELVVIALRAALYVHGPMDYGFMEKGRAKFAIGSTEGPLSSRLEHEDFLIGQLTKTIEALKDAGKDVVLVYPTPESGNHVPDALLRVSLLKGDVVDLTIPRDLFEKRNLSLLERYDQITQEQSIQGIRPYETLCNADDCKFYLDGQVLFYDATHLSTVGAKLFAPEFENVFKRLN